MMTTLAVLVLTASWADGGLALDEIEDVITFHDADLSDCVKGKTSGAPVMLFGISGDGGVLWNSVLRDSKPERAVCFSKQFRTWVFPPKASGTRVELEWKPVARRIRIAAAGDGGLPIDSVVQVQREHSSDVEACYQHNRKRTDNEGVFATEVVIAPSGVVMESIAGEPSTRLVGTDVSECVAEAARGWQFPKGRGFTRTSLDWIVAANFERVNLLASSAQPNAVSVNSGGALWTKQQQFESAIADEAPSLNVCSELVDGGVTVNLEIRLLAGGRLAGIRADEVSPVADCVVREVSKWPFPATSNQVILQSFLIEQGVARKTSSDAASGLPKDEIMRVIRSHQHEVRFCYDQALQADPSLKAKVAIAWVIGPDGTVQSATVTEGTDSSLANCVAARVRRWIFPPPFGGGTVNVSFPWLFKAAGSDD